MDTTHFCQEGKILTIGPRLPCLICDMSGDGPMGPIDPRGPGSPGGPGDPGNPWLPFGPGAPVIQKGRVKVTTQLNTLIRTSD